SRNQADNGVTAYASTMPDAAWRSRTPSTDCPEAITRIATATVMTDAAIDPPSATHLDARARAAHASVTTTVAIRTIRATGTPIAISVTTFNSTSPQRLQPLHQTSSTRLTTKAIT